MEYVFYARQGFSEINGAKQQQLKTDSIICPIVIRRGNGGFFKDF